MDCRDCGAVLPAGARFCLQCGARIQVARESADPLRDALERAIGFQYRIERLLGRGGMGAVYLAHELALDRDVAIKVLPPEHAGAPQMRDRFRREARTAARLTHPNIVPLHTFGEVDGLMYFVMGYVSGESLASRLKREGAFPSDEARTLVASIADALEYAHRHGIVHRDLKPDNILIDESGAPMLTDFGIAKISVGDAQLTSTGQIMGTPHYMSPEQAMGRSDVDARSDLYSLGIVAYEMTSGRRPFDADSALTALTQRLTQDPRPLQQAAPDADRDLVAAIMRCLERQASNRWPDAKSFRAALGAGEDDAEDTLASRLFRAGVGFMLICLISIVYMEVIKRFNPANDLWRFERGLGIFAVTWFVFIVPAVITLKREGLDRRGIVWAALRQPRWWRFWYPKPYRRRGDVWDRLPMRIRRFRFQAAVTLCLMLGLLPLYFALNSSRPVLGWILPVIQIALVASMFIERGRTTKYVAATLGVSNADASRILSTPSWRTSVWQGEPAAQLLNRNRTRPVGPLVAEVTTQAVKSKTDPADAPTRW